MKQQGLKENRKSQKQEGILDGYGSICLRGIVVNIAN